MFGNGRIFISHTHADNAACETLLAALDAWEVDYWFDKEQLSAGQDFYDRIQVALADRDIFVRVCTPRAMGSHWMGEEQRLARNLRAPNRTQRRLIINLLLVPGYLAQPGEAEEITIDATSQPQMVWLDKLRQTLGVPSRERRMSRRTLLALGGVSLVALGAAGYAADLYFTRSTPTFIPTVHQPTPTPLPGASRIRWSYTFPNESFSSGFFPDGVTLVNGRLYCASAPLESLVALDASNGALLWQQRIADSIYEGVAPTLVGDTLYLPHTNYVSNPAGDGGVATQATLSAFSAMDGASRWSVPIATDLSSSAVRVMSPVAAADNIALVRSNQTLYAFNATTGAALWQQSAGAPPTLNYSLSVGVFPAPVVANGIAYIVLGDGKLYAFSARNGNPVWSAPFTAAGAISTPPVVANGAIYVADADKQGQIYALDAATGQLHWSHSITTASSTAPDGTPYGPLAVPGLTLSDGALYVNTGFSLPTSFTIGSTVTGPAVVARDAATGQYHWGVDPSTSLKLPGGVYPDAMLGSPLVIGSTLYGMSRTHPLKNGLNMNVLFALNTTDGSVKWFFETPGGFSLDDAGSQPSALAVSSDTLYMSSGANTLYAIALDS